MTLLVDELFLAAQAVVDRVRETQRENIHKAAALLAERLFSGGVIHVFGSGHSRAFAMELCNRAGGLVPMHAMALDDLVRAGRQPEDLKGSTTERDPANAHLLLSLHDIRPEDGFILVSNSGRNAMPVELGLEVKRRGLPLVVVTSLAHASSVTSRHSSGKRLHELADVVIDNCAPLGDALLPIPGHNWNCCSVSSISGAFIAQALTAEWTEAYLGRGETPPVLISANVDGGDAHNEALRQRYAGRI